MLDLVGVEVIADFSESKVEELLGCGKYGRSNLENAFKKSGCKWEEWDASVKHGEEGKRFDMERKETEGETV